MCRARRTLSHKYKDAQCCFGTAENELSEAEIFDDVGDVDERLRNKGSSSLGQGHSWQATQREGKWRLQCLLLDKLKRPMRFEGKVAGEIKDLNMIFSLSLFSSPDLAKFLSFFLFSGNVWKCEVFLEIFESCKLFDVF